MSAKSLTFTIYHLALPHGDLKVFSAVRQGDSLQQSIRHTTYQAEHVPAVALEWRPGDDLLGHILPCQLLNSVELRRRSWSTQGVVQGTGYLLTSLVDILKYFDPWLNYIGISGSDITLPIGHGLQHFQRVLPSPQA